MRAVRSDKGIAKFNDRQVVEMHSIPEPNSGCWLWLGNLNGWGYGRLGSHRHERQAHRLSYSAFKGPIPQGVKVLHRCDLPCCVNPDHLRLGTLSDNVQDAITRGRHKAPRGENNGLAKLTRDAVAVIRSCKVEYGTISKLAREFGVSRRAIGFVLKGDTWA